MAEVRGRRANGEELGEERLVLDERDSRLGVVGYVLDLLGRQGVVDADRGAARVNQGQVGDHVLRHVAGHDQPELLGSEAELAQGHRHGGDLLSILAPGQLVPVAVGAPVQGGPVGPVPGRLREDRADRLSRNRYVDVGSLSRYIHVIPPQVLVWRPVTEMVPALSNLHYLVVGRG